LCLLARVGVSETGPEYLAWPWASGRSFDPVRARELLAQAGWRANKAGMLEKDGGLLELRILSTRSPSEELSFFMKELGQLGGLVRFRRCSGEELSRLVQSRDFDLLEMNWPAGRLPDPLPLWHSEAKGVLNIAGLNDPVVDALILSQRMEIQISDRLEILRTLDLRLAELAPAVRLAGPEPCGIVYRNTLGAPSSPFAASLGENFALRFFWNKGPERANSTK
ncbi:MAG: hypothetical protein HQL31_12615, partial [Planctomycetes bacterium]|nr:hypothetical protein [Planctomycetota bacterium]